MHSLMKNRPYFVGIAGGSGSGKSTICGNLQQMLGNQRVALVSCDHYYRSLDHVPRAERAETNFDHPAAIDFELLCEHLRSLRGGKAVTVPQYCFDSHTRRLEGLPLSPSWVVLVEGVLLFTDAGVRELLDLRLYLKATDRTRYQRRIERDTAQRGRNTESIAAQWQNTVAPMYAEFVEPSRCWAHFVVSTEQGEDATLKHIDGIIQREIGTIMGPAGAEPEC